MPESPEEGWYTDPYELHEARWYSQGRPTKLVRDRGVEAYEDPPDGPSTGVAEKIVIDPPASLGSSNLHRADDAELEQFDPEDETRAAWDSFDNLGGYVRPTHDP